MHPDLTKLLDLQAKDIELLEVDSRLHQLDSERAALDVALLGARESVSSAARAVAVEQKKRDELEAQIEAHRNHQEKRKEKLEFMKTPKEVAALMAEIDLARGALSTEENEWVRSSDQVGQLESRKAEAEAQVQGIEQAQATARAALEERRRELDSERKAVLHRREASAAHVTRPLLQHYDKLRTSTTRRSVVVVAINGPACGACFTTIPLSRRTQIKSGTVIEGCESCGVILYSAE